MNDLAELPRLSPEDLLVHAQGLYGKKFALECVYAVECAEGILLVHDFFRPEDASRAGATCLIPHGDTAPSITHIFPGAAWHERETADMLGVAFSTMDCLPLLLDPGMPPGVLSRPPAERPSLKSLGFAVQSEGEAAAPETSEGDNG